MKPKATENDISNVSLIPTRLIRNSLILYLLSAATVPVICFIFGWRSLDHIGTGFIYGSLGLVLFGALTFAANNVPSQLSKLSLPKYKPPSRNRLQETLSENSQTNVEGKNFFLIVLISGALLLVTGLILKLF